MQILKTINGMRRAVMRRITRRLGVTRINGTLDTENAIKRVLICRPNHRLGNLLLITPLLQEVADTLPRAKIDLFVKGTIAPVLFKNYENVNQIIQLPKKPLKDVSKYLRGWFTIKRLRYDLVINVVNHSSSGKLSAQFANARHRFLGEINPEIQLRYDDHRHMAKYPVYSFRNFINIPEPDKNAQPVPTLDLKLDAREIALGKKILDDLVKNEKPSICLYTYATGAKCYDSHWWQDFYEKVVLQFPGYNVVELLPIENVSQISFRAPSFYSKDLRAIGGFVANTHIFIGADSGMMHLASAVHVPTVGLFKSQNMPTYAPYGNDSVGINTNSVNAEGLLRVMADIFERRQ